MFHDAAAGGRRTIDAGGPTHPDFADHQAQHVLEVQGEALRLAYVALTRARHQTVLHWASSWDSRQSPLARLLFAADLDPDAVELADAARGERGHRADAGDRRATPPARSRSRRRPDPGSVRWTPPAASSTTLEVRPFDRSFDGAWRRASYSGLTSAAKEQAVTSEAEVAGIEDEEIDLAGVSVVAPDDGERERLTAVDAAARRHGRAARASARWSTPCSSTPTSPPPISTASCAVRFDHEAAWSAAGIDVPSTTVVRGLGLAIETPLGPLVGDVRLRDIPTADRLDELTFELPLAGGDTPVGRAPRRTRSPTSSNGTSRAGDVLAGYARHLRDPLLDQRVRGYLTGSIDAVLRVPGADGAPRFAVVDYKSNWLGVDGGEITAWDYRPAALTTAMMHAHYPLQALFYVVALHRYLRWRLPGYDPDVHLAGVALPVPPGHGRTRHAAGRRRSRAGCSRGGRRRP